MVTGLWVLCNLAYRPQALHTGEPSVFLLHKDVECVLQLAQVGLGPNLAPRLIGRLTLFSISGLLIATTF